MSDIQQPQGSHDTTEVLSKLVDHLSRDHELRQDYLKHNEAEFKHRKWKNRALIVVFGAPALLWMLMIADVIKARSIVGDYVSLVRVEGVISADKPASAKKLVPAIKQAFEDEDAKGVVLVINSPGGTPVQADLIHSAIKQFSQENPDKPYIAVGEDFMTSGAYWVASAAPEICVNKSTVTGSIGVIVSSFGVDLTKFAKNYGIERRVTTAGNNKNRNDMFLPQIPDDVAKMQQMLTEVHQHFMSTVLTSRNGRLKAEEKVAFSGDHWTGEKAVEMGLADGFCDLSSVLRDKFNVEVVADYTPRATFYDNMKRALSTETRMSEIVNWLNVSNSPQILAM